MLCRVPLSTSHCSPVRFIAARTPIPTSRRQQLRPTLVHDSKAPQTTTSGEASSEPASSAPAADSLEPVSSPTDQYGRPVDGKKRTKQQAGSTDPISTFLTRRFGLTGGLGWLVFLAIGSLGEQIKTRLEVSSEEAGQHDVAAADQRDVLLAPGGVRVRDLVIGGGQAPGKGMLVIVDYVGKADGVVFEDTRARGKPIVFFFGGRPYTGGMCAGAEQALAGMKAGGRRIVTVPPELGFGDSGADIRPTEHVPDKQVFVPPGATLEYDIELLRVSVPPS